MSRGKIIGIGVGVIVLALLFTVAKPDRRSAVLLPSPNGYDDFLAVATTINGERPDESSGATIDDFRQYVSKNDEVLKRIRTGLEKKWRAPLLKSDQTSMDLHFQQLPAAKKIAWLFEAEGKVAAHDTNFVKAAEAYFDAIRFGQEFQRGGVLIDMLVGISCEAIGTGAFQGIVNDLDAKQCRSYVQQLSQHDDTREPWIEIEKNEKEFAKSMGYRYYLEIAAQAINSVFTGKPGSLKSTIAKAEQRYKKQHVRYRDLMLALAARAYELENGSAPKSVQELVPEYLKAVPIDPVTGKSMTLGSAK